MIMKYYVVYVGYILSTRTVELYQIAIAVAFYVTLQCVPNGIYRWQLSRYYRDIANDCQYMFVIWDILMDTIVKFIFVVLFSNIANKIKKNCLILELEYTYKILESNNC